MTGNANNELQGAERRRLSSRTPAPLVNEFEIDLRGIFLFFFRRRKIILGATLLGFVFAFIYSAMQPNEYVAKTVMQLNTNSAKIVDIAAITSGAAQSEANAKQTEVDILLSREVAGRVVDAMNLYENPEFNTSLNKSMLGHTKDWLKGLFFDKPQLTEAQLAERKRLLRIGLTSKLLSKVKVNNHPRSKTVDVLVRSLSPLNAADVANGYTEEYMKYQMDMKYETTERANEWLTQRLETLRKNMNNSELAVQEYREEHGLYESLGVMLSDTQVSELNSQLIMAKAKRAEAESKLKAVRRLIRSKNGLSSSSDVLKSSVIEDLRINAANLSSKKAELATRYGQKHPRMINLEAEIKGVQASIKREVSKMVASLKSDVEIAKSREDTLSKSLISAQGGVGETNAAAVKLGALVRDVEANQKLYESFLTRYKELSQHHDIVQANSRVIAHAEVPYSAKYPRTKLILLIGLIFGGMVGVAIAMLIEKLDVGFHSLDELEKASAYVGLGLVPSIPEGTNAASYVMERLSSEFSESVRSVMTAIHYSNTQNPPKSVMVTSSVTGEGKSLLTLSMGRLAAKSGKKVLVIDCDMRRPSFSNYLEAKFDYALDDYLRGEKPVSKVTYRDKESGMDVIFAKPDTKYSQELLASEKMAEFVKEMSEKYDFVFLDTPPVAAVSDALMVATMVDTTLFVCGWNKTPKEIVTSVLKKFRDCKVRVAGVVLNNVDMERGSEYGYGDCFKEYKEYYNS